MDGKLPRLNVHFTPQADLADLVRDSGTKPPASAQVSAPSPWRHISFDNLAFADATTRVEYSVRLIDAVADVCARQAVADEQQAAAISASANALSAQLGATGQGIAKAIDGTKARQASVLDTGLSAFTGLFGGGSAKPSVPAPSLSDVGNGPSSVFCALKSWSAALQEQAAHRLAAVARQKQEVEQLRRLRAMRNGVVEPQLQRGYACIVETQGKAKVCDAAQGRIERARRALTDVENALLAHSRSASAPPAQQAELMKRQQSCMGELENAQEALLGATEALVAARRRRDEELTVIARELQKFDEECQSSLIRVITHIAGLASDEASASLMLSHRLNEAVAVVSLQSDSRTFLYQRRIALLLQEQVVRLDAKTGSASSPAPSSSSSSSVPGDSSLGSDVESLVPQPQPVALAVRHSKDFLETDAVVSPIMATWVVAILEGKGRERWPAGPGGQEPAQGKSNSNSNTKEGSNGMEGAGQSGASGVVFDVAYLCEHPARIAFLKSLNQQRSINKDVSKAFTRLAQALWLLLDAADAQEDVCCARITMIMAETFYETVPLPQDSTEEAGTGDSEGATSRTEGSRDSRGRHRDRRFLQDVLRHHPIWKREGLWEEIFYESLYEAIKATGQAALSSAAGSRASARASNSSTVDGEPASPVGGMMPSSARPGTAEFNHAYTQTVMSNLAAVAMNMATFGVSHAVVQRTILGLARANGLSSDMISALIDIGKSERQSR